MRSCCLFRILARYKVDSASTLAIETVRHNLRQLNPRAPIIETASTVRLDDPDLVKGKRVLVVEDGPTVAHGEMAYGAAMLAVRKYGAKEIVDPKPFAVGSIKIFEKYSHLKSVLPAMGYGKPQIMDLEQTIEKIDCDAAILGTPTDIRRIVTLGKSAGKVSFEIEERRHPTLEDVLRGRLTQLFS